MLIDDSKKTTMGFIESTLQQLQAMILRVLVVLALLCACQANVEARSVLEAGTDHLRTGDSMEPIKPIHASAPAESTEGKTAATAAEEEDDEPSHIRTATGGAIYSLILMLTLFAFVGNGAFLVYVFLLAK